MPLKVLIAGAGIAGLASAIALGREGHEVEIFEKSAFSSEIGAAFHFGPYACRILRQWGVDLTLMRPCVCKRWRNLYSHDLTEMLLKFDLEEKKKALGVEDDEIMIYRIDAHNVLRDHALAMPNVTLRLSSGIKSVDPEQGKITLTTGAEHYGDLIVGADGVHSKALQSIDLEASKTRHTDINLYRFMVKIGDARSVPIVSSMLDSVGFPDTHNTIINTKTHQVLVMYSCRGGELINCATFQHSASEKVQLTDNYTNPGTVEEVLHVMDTWPEQFKSLARLADDIKHWASVGRDVPKTFIKGRLVVVGDAAHPIMPTHAAGANMGIEDAGVLGTFVDRTATTDNLAQRLDLYNAARYPRTVTVKFASEMVTLNPTKETSDHTERLLQEKIPGATIPQDMEAYLWPFDALEDARRSLAGAVAADEERD